MSDGPKDSLKDMLLKTVRERGDYGEKWSRLDRAVDICAEWVDRTDGWGEVRDLDESLDKDFDVEGMKVFLEVQVRGTKCRTPIVGMTCSSWDSWQLRRYRIPPPLFPLFPSLLHQVLFPIAPSPGFHTLTR